jgi:hypothetical protein
MSNELSKRAVACKHWRWMKGMAYWRQGNRYRTEDDTRVTYDETCLPDLTDPATLGCLLHLVREAWGESGLYCVRNRGVWWVEWTVEGFELSSPMKLSGAETEAEALVAALEMSP